MAKLKCEAAARITLLLLLLTVTWSSILLDSWSKNFPQVVSRESALSGTTKAIYPVIFDPWQEDQSRRRQTLRRSCSKYRKGKPPFGAFKLSRLRRKFLNKLIVDDIHHSLYCYIPKIACTNWKRLMMILSKRTNETSPSKISSWLPHEPGVLKMLSDQTLQTSVVVDRLKYYKKFLFVRHPYERLVSAFRNKLEGRSATAQQFKLNYGPKIKKDYRPGDKILFSNFVDYLIEVNAHKRAFDEHWAPFVNLCHPCHIEYDFIGKYESLIEDSEQILREISAPPDLYFPPFKSSKTPSFVSSYFQTLTANQTNELYRIYEADFLVFGYSNDLSEFWNRKDLKSIDGSSLYYNNDSDLS